MNLMRQVLKENLTGEVDIEGKVEAISTQQSPISVLILIMAIIGLLFGLYVLISF